MKINPSTILDIGCGTGELLSELTEIFPKAILNGCDMSIESGKLLKTNISSAEFHCIDVEKNNHTLPQNSFDLITCSEVLEHCINPASVVRNAFHWLKPGGVFFITVPSGAMTGYDKMIGHLKHYNAKEVNALLQKEGFFEITVNYWGAPFHTLYKIMVGIASKNIKQTNELSTKYTWTYAICGKIFNILFYLNFLRNNGRQIFAWGIKT